MHHSTRAPAHPPSFPAAASGRVHVAVSQLDALRASLNGSASWVVGSWASKGDLISGLAASSHIPCFSGAPGGRGPHCMKGGGGRGREEASAALGRRGP